MRMHQAGDECLRLVAKALKKNARNQIWYPDMAGRVCSFTSRYFITGSDRMHQKD